MHSDTGILIRVHIILLHPQAGLTIHVHAVGTVMYQVAHQYYCCACAYTHTNKYINMCKYEWKYANVYIFIHVYTHMYKYIHAVGTEGYSHGSHMNESWFTGVHQESCCACIYKHTHIKTCIDMYICARVYINTHMYV